MVGFDDDPGICSFELVVTNYLLIIKMKNSDHVVEK